VEGGMMEKKRFNLILTKEIITADENTTVPDMVSLMVKFNIGAVVIMRGEKLVGIVSERDIVRRVVGKHLSLKTTKAKDFMTKKVVTAELSEGFANIRQKLFNLKFRHLPIINKGKLVGIASQRDIFSKSLHFKIDAPFGIKW
jgi:CBS domain-containing protein